MNAAGVGNAASAAWNAAASGPPRFSRPLTTAWKAVVPAAIPAAMVAAKVAVRFAITA